MRRAVLISLCLLCCILLADLSFAVEGNTRKGKFLYRKNCRSCHGVSASDLSPLSKTQAAWKAAAASHESIPCVKDWPQLSAGDRADIFSYLYAFAADSPTPAKCD
ncbi:MAG: cytochrome c [Desulfovibrio sp.]|jgi:mono/diheme cytochrome c family protein|nr:cytochrome c [Desulfovibrio sp.]